MHSDQIKAVCEATNIFYEEEDNEGTWELKNWARHQMPGGTYDPTGTRGDVLTPEITDEVWERYVKFQKHFSAGLLLACGATAENFRDWKPRSDSPACSERDAFQAPFEADRLATARAAVPTTQLQLFEPEYTRGFPAPNGEKVYFMPSSYMAEAWQQTPIRGAECVPRDQLVQRWGWTYSGTKERKDQKSNKINVKNCCLKFHFPRPGNTWSGTLTENEART